MFLSCGCLGEYSPEGPLCGLGHHPGASGPVLAGTSSRPSAPSQPGRGMFPTPGFIFSFFSKTQDGASGWHLWVVGEDGGPF